MSGKPINKVSQITSILKHLQNKGEITALEALGMFGCYRLQARISDLRNLGYQIDTLMKKDSMGRSYACYFMEFTSQMEKPYKHTVYWDAKAANYVKV